eukprot:m.231608 g.231608  ORF g.231608 m.231608 type:complete len:685 (-) comp10874_c0_seq5:154-2208(-)
MMQASAAITADAKVFNILLHITGINCTDQTATLWFPQADFSKEMFQPTIRIFLAWLRRLQDERNIFQACGLNDVKLNAVDQKVGLKLLAYDTEDSEDSIPILGHYRPTFEVIGHELHLDESLESVNKIDVRKDQNAWSEVIAFELPYTGFVAVTSAPDATQEKPLNTRALDEICDHLFHQNPSENVLQGLLQTLDRHCSACFPPGANTSDMEKLLEQSGKIANCVATQSTQSDTQTELDSNDAVDVLNENFIKVQHTRSRSSRSARQKANSKTPVAQSKEHSVQIHALTSNYFPRRKPSQKPKKLSLFPEYFTAVDAGDIASSSAQGDDNMLDLFPNNDELTLLERFVDKYLRLTIYFLGSASEERIQRLMHAVIQFLLKATELKVQDCRQEPGLTLRYQRKWYKGFTDLAIFGKVGSVDVCLGVIEVKQQINKTQHIHQAAAEQSSVTLLHTGSKTMDIEDLSAAGFSCTGIVLAPKAALRTRLVQSADAETKIFYDHCESEGLARFLRDAFHDLARIHRNLKKNLLTAPELDLSRLPDEDDQGDENDDDNDDGNDDNDDGDDCGRKRKRKRKATANPECKRKRNGQATEMSRSGHKPKSAGKHSLGHHALRDISNTAHASVGVFVPPSPPSVSCRDRPINVVTNASTDEDWIIANKWSRLEPLPLETRVHHWAHGMQYDLQS